MAKSKRVLLIGGAGFIGAHLCKTLSSAGAEVTVLSKNTDKIRKLRLGGKIKYIKGDAADYGAVLRSIKNQDWIINLASVIQPLGNFDPYRDAEANCRAQLHILEARRKTKSRARYLFIGSRAQFGIVERKDLPVREDYPQNPISLYGIHKQTAEQYCWLYQRAFNLNSIVIRLPQVYGPSLAHDATPSIIDKFVKIALENKQFRVNGYGRDIKDFVHVNDVVDVVVKILRSNVAEGTFNVGSGTGVALINVAKKILRACGSGSFKLVPFPKNLAPFELGSFYFDISRVSKQFKWKPKVGLDEGIERTVMHYKNNNRRQK